MTFDEWLEKNPPQDMPYWPGATYTGRFGLRQSQALLEMGTSPFHLGVDRAGGGDYLMPFDGRIVWRVVGGVAGTLLRIIPDDCPDMEIQVFHTEHDGAGHLDMALRKGDKMPVWPSDLGLSTAVHTHTEVLFPATDRYRLRFLSSEDRLISDGIPLYAAIRDHCERHDLRLTTVLEGLSRQTRSPRRGGWGLTEATSNAAIRTELPLYRIPRWDGATVLIDSMQVLKI